MSLNTGARTVHLTMTRSALKRFAGVKIILEMFESSDLLDTAVDERVCEDCERPIEGVGE